MADGPSNDAPTGAVTLTVWALATVDVTLFVLLAVLAAHASGALGDLLAGLNTVLGLAIFGYLWLLVSLAVRWVLASADLDATPLRRLALRGMAAGAVVGIVFLLGVVLVAVLPRVVTSPLEPLSVALVALFGTLIAAPVGAILGLCFGLVDLAVYRLAGTAVPAGAEQRESATVPDRQ